MRANPLNYSVQHPKLYNSHYKTRCIVCDQAKGFIQPSYPVYSSQHPGYIYQSRGNSGAYGHKKSTNFITSSRMDGPNIKLLKTETLEAANSS